MVTTTVSRISDYLSLVVRFQVPVDNGKLKSVTLARFQKALECLPEDVLDLFLSGARQLTVLVVPDPGLPMGMSTRSAGPPDRRRYTVTVFEEHQSWAENHFLGAFLRELGHVVGGRPPEEEWPSSRAERALYKEMLECRADAMVWKWGLKHYSLSYLHATFPPHWVDRIVSDISRTILEDYETP